MLKVSETVIFTVVMGGVIFFCRFFPFLFFRGTEETSGKQGKLFSSFLGFVEKVAPPVAMTVLAFNALSAPLKDDLRQGIPILIAITFTVLVHLWKRNPLFSIFGGTLLYMILSRILGNFYGFI
jgi:branched-subunit amino acid transport protein AzlD